MERGMITDEDEANGVSASGGAPVRPKRPAFFCDSSSLVYFLIFVISLVAAVLIPLYANWARQ